MMITHDMRADLPTSLAETTMITDLKAKDVILSDDRGRHQPGNAAFRQLINKQRSAYANSLTSDKERIAMSIVAVMRKHGSRFVEADGSGWREVGDERAVETTSRALEAEMRAGSAITTASATVKEERYDDLTDCSEQSEPQSTKQDHLLELTSEQARAMRFPPGCRVLYNYRQKNKASSIGAREGVVKSVAMTLVSRRFEYTVVSSASGHEQTVEQVSESEMAYAIGSSVLVSVDSKQICGTVVYARPSGGHMRHIVQYDLNSSTVFEENVTPERLSYVSLPIETNTSQAMGRPITGPQPRQDQSSRKRKLSTAASEESGDDRSTNSVPDHSSGEQFTLTDNDVLLGRGSTSQRHPGNVTYRLLVDACKEIYAICPKFHKVRLSRAIVATVRSHGRRFLQAVEDGEGLYRDIGDAKAAEKTSQALREGQPAVRTGMSAWTSEKRQEFERIVGELAFDEHTMNAMGRIMEARAAPAKHHWKAHDMQGMSSVADEVSAECAQTHTINQSMVAGQGARVPLKKRRMVSENNRETVISS